MAYIIENAHILKGEEIKDLSLLVENNRISYSRPSFKLYKHLRMNADDYIMTPTYVILDANLPLTQPFTERKAYYLENFLKKGCTTILTSTPIKREKQLISELKKTQTQLLDCPLDHVIGVRIQPGLLTPSFVRKCKKEKVPVIFVEIYSEEEMSKIPWGWIKEAMFPYNSPLIPIFLNKEKRLPKVWGNFMKAYNIPCVHDQIQEGVPLERKVLEQIGIFPKKSNLHGGGEVSYNFYLKDRETVKMIESELFMKDESSLVMTIHKGNVIRAGSRIYYRPGYGEHVEIKTPSFYRSPI